MTKELLDQLFERLDEFDGIYIDEDDESITIQTLEDDTCDIRDILDELGIDYDESDFWQSNMCGTNFYIDKQEVNYGLQRMANCQVEERAS